MGMGKRTTSTLLLAAALLVVMAVPAGAGGGWQQGAPFPGGPACDFNGNGVDDGYATDEIPFTYHLAGKMKGDTLTGRIMQRFTNVPYTAGYRGNDPDVGDLEPVILVSGKITNIGQFTSGDFTDTDQIETVGDTLLVKWRYTITDLDGNFLTVTGGLITVDVDTGGFTTTGYGPCSQP